MVPSSEVAVPSSEEGAVVPSLEEEGVCRPRYHPMEGRSTFEEIGRSPLRRGAIDKIELLKPEGELMQPDEAWGPRWHSCAHPLSHRYMEVACDKRSLVVLAADVSRVDDLVELVESVGPHIAGLKTHVDMTEGFTIDEWGRVVDVAKKHDLLIFEDRKFADIGRVTETQMGGMYDIRSWADLVTSHSISGPDIVDGIAAAWDSVQRIGGVLLLAQMSSRGNLLEAGYTDSTIEMGTASPHVIGYIGNGSNPDDISSLRAKVGEGRMIWTPGVNLSAEEGVLGQRYGHPSDAIIAGSDAVIVGSGIHNSEDPAATARAYGDATWAALMSR